MSKEDLSSILWRERDLLDTLLYKLEIEQLVLAGSRTKWLAAAAREVELVLDRIREAEVLRALEVDTVGAELGLGTNASLREIAENCEEPWRTIFFDHREAFTTVATEISSMSESNRDLLTAGYHAAQATLLELSDGTGTYGSDGAVAADRRSSLFDRSL